MPNIGPSNPCLLYYPVLHKTTANHHHETTLQKNNTFVSSNSRIRPPIDEPRAAPQRRLSVRETEYRAQMHNKNKVSTTRLSKTTEHHTSVSPINHRRARWAEKHVAETEGARRPLSKRQPFHTPLPILCYGSIAAFISCGEAYI